MVNVSSRGLIVETLMMDDDTNEELITSEYNVGA